MLLLTNRLPTSLLCVVFCATIQTANADSISSTFNVDVEADVSQDEAWSINEFVPGFGAGGSFALLFPTTHALQMLGTLPVSIEISAPDVVSPGEIVELTTSVSFAGLSLVSFSSEVTYDFGFALVTDEGTIPLADASSFASLPVNPLQGLLTGSASWSATDTGLTPLGSSDVRSSASEDAFGDPAVVPVGTPIIGSGFYLGSGSFQAWSVPEIEILGTMGPALPGAGLLSLFYDVELEADYEITEYAFLVPDLATGYFAYDGGMSLVPLNTGVGAPATIEIPTDLEDGEIFEIELAALGLDYTTEVLYSVNGFSSYGACTAACLIGLGGWRDDDGYLSSWVNSRSQLVGVPEPNTLTFTISAPVGAPEPGTLALIGIGLAVMSLARRRKVA